MSPERRIQNQEIDSRILESSLRVSQLFSEGGVITFGNELILRSELDKRTTRTGDAIPGSKIRVVILPDTIDSLYPEEKDEGKTVIMRRLKNGKKKADLIVNGIEGYFKTSLEDVAPDIDTRALAINSVLDAKKGRINPSS